MSIKCPKCDGESLSVDFVSSGYPVSDGRGGIDWETDEAPTISGVPFCMECDKESTIREIEEYNEYCYCGKNLKMENSEVCKECL